MTLSGCKKDAERPAAEPTVASLPFENAAIKIDLVTTTLPGWVQAVFFTNAAVGFVATHDGKIYRTTDGGKSWALQFSSPDANLPLLQMLFTDTTVGYAVGGSTDCNGAGCTPPGGLILKTTDGGTTWAPIYRATGVVLSALAANRRGELLAVSNGTGAQILKSADAGARWLPVAAWPYQLTKIAFDRDQGFCASASGKIIRSPDNGATWAEAATFDYPYLNELAFSTGIGFCATGYGPVYKTTDNGSTWLPISRSSFSARVINALTPTSCLVFGAGRYSGGDFGTYDGAFRQSADAGTSWTDVELKAVRPVQYTSFYTSRDGYAVAGTALLKVRVK